MRGSSRLCFHQGPPPQHPTVLSLECAPSPRSVGSQRPPRCGQPLSNWPLSVGTDMGDCRGQLGWKGPRGSFSTGPQAPPGPGVAHGLPQLPAGPAGAQAAPPLPGTPLPLATLLRPPSSHSPVKLASSPLGLSLRVAPAPGPSRSVNTPLSPSNEALCPQGQISEGSCRVWAHFCVSGPTYCWHWTWVDGRTDEQCDRATLITRVFLIQRLCVLAPSGRRVA